MARHIVALALLALLLTVPLAQGQASGRDQVLLIEVEGVVTGGTALYVQQGIEEAQDRGIPVLIQLNTPGGLVDATLEIFQTIDQSQVPVMTFVGPRGGFAASAGTFILLMGHPSGMAPNTQIGSAQPIQQNPAGGTTNASEKTVNFLVQRMEGIAERTGRNTTIATRFITENLNMDQDRALETGMIDAVSPDVQTFLSDVDGMEAITSRGPITLETDRAEVVPYERSLMVQIVDLIGNPQVSFILFLVGLYGMIFGL
ncbi:MAG: ATP-dependent Clp protease proteolytic subunit, partial [Candidatus Thermoplasmatota archaeon]|nr:ATP-dependent Clp protease proteolytic subunit [Candidatus Thermoplasmatota archaeon]